MSTTNRWYLVLQRYISYISGRVAGLGGNPGSILPSPHGAIPIIKPKEYSGKVSAIDYDHFGDFEGFKLLMEHGKEENFVSKEKGIEEIIRFAWERRVWISVLGSTGIPKSPISIALCRLPDHEGPFH